jgi:8-hydroxy-5-deazaflavin:NADPH oxidoreductase
MDIAIVGSGHVGKALGDAWKAAGHRVTFGVRDPASPKAVDLRGGKFGVASVADAARGAAVLLLAVPWPELADAIESAGPLAGKIVIDATNPLTPALELAIGYTESAGETAGRLAKGARVVKAFNTTGAENMVRAREVPSRPLMFVAGDDVEAKKTAQRLAADIGFEPVDAGPLRASRLLEPIAMQWIKLAYGGLGTNFAYAFVRR